MNPEEIERIAYITHIHEASVKSAEINSMLREFYRDVCRVAKMNGIRLSVLNPMQEEAMKESI